MRVGGVAASMIILLAGSAALAADVAPGDGSAPSLATQGATQTPAAPGSGASANGPAALPFLSALPDNYFATTPYLLGEWPAIRSKLNDLGIQVSLTGVDEAVLNLSGGLRQNAQEAGQVAFQAEFDLQKSLGLTGARFLVTLVDRWGRNAAVDAGIPALQLLNEVYGRGNIVAARAIRLGSKAVRRPDRNHRRPPRLRRRVFQLPLRLHQSDLLPRAGGQPGRRLHLQLAGQPMGRCRKAQFRVAGLSPGRHFRREHGLSQHHAEPRPLANRARELPGRHCPGRSRVDAKIRRASGELPGRRLVEQQRGAECRDQHRWRADPGVGTARGSRPRTLRFFHRAAAAAHSRSRERGPEKRLERLCPRDLRGSPHIHARLPDLLRASCNTALGPGGPGTDLGSRSARRMSIQISPMRRSWPTRWASAPAMCSATNT